MSGTRQNVSQNSANLVEILPNSDASILSHILKLFHFQGKLINCLLQWEEEAEERGGGGEAGVEERDGGGEAGAKERGGGGETGAEERGGGGEAGAMERGGGGEEFNCSIAGLFWL